MVTYRSDDTDDWTTTAEPRFEPAATDDRQASIDELLSTLSHRRRRDVLYALSENEVMDAESLATRIAASEADCPPERIDADDRKSVLIELSHVHLPKLADRRAIEYDRRSGAVRWSAPSDDLESLLDCCRRLETEAE